MRWIILISIALAAAANSGATTVYLHSAEFFAALSQASVRIEDFSTANNGQVISDGSTLDGLAYGPFTLTGNASTLDITDIYGSISGKSLGANHIATDGAAATYFKGGEGTRVTFASPVYAVGVFFNVNANSGLFSVVTSEGSVGNDASMPFETSALSQNLVFAGIIADHPFVSFEILSTGNDAVYNVAEIASVAQTPEPATFALAAVALAAIALRRRR